LKARSFRNADTGVSRSPAMSNGGFINAKTHPGCVRRWVRVAHPLWIF